MPSSYTQDTASLKKFLATVHLLKGISEQQLNQLISVIQLVKFNPGEYIVREGDKAEELFLIQTGQIEILKNSIDHNSQRISVIEHHTIIGEFAFFENSIRTASARALTDVLTIKIAIHDLRLLSTQSAQENNTYDVLNKLKRLLFSVEKTAKEQSIHYLINTNLAKELGKRLQQTNESAVDALQKQLTYERARNLAGHLFVYNYTIIALYVFSLSILSKLVLTTSSTTIYSAPLLILAAIINILLVKYSEYPLSFYGLTMQHWLHDLIEAFLYTIPMLAVVTLLKLFTIHFVPQFSTEKLFEFSLLEQALTDNSSIALYGAILYLALIPLQELIFRSVTQSILQEFLGNQRKWTAIMLANLCFGMIHLHLSFILAVGVMLPGLFWGWLYAKQRSLLGVSVSHVILGFWGFFILGLG